MSGSSNRFQTAKVLGIPGADFCLAILAVVYLGMTTVCQATDTFPTPAWLEITPVAEKMVVNGLPSTVSYFRANRTPEEVIDFYRHRWAEGVSGRSGYREAEVDSWHVISRLDRRLLLTVQARRNGSLASEGYLAVANLQEARAESKRNDRLPRLQESDIVSDLTSYDPGSKARTVMLMNSYSVTRNSDYYRNYFIDHGFGQVVDQQNGDSRVLVFGKNGSESHLVISPSGSGSRVVMNLINED